MPDNRFSTMQPVAPAAPMPQKPTEAASIWMSSVIAPFAQNLGGALGVAVLVLVGGLIANTEPVATLKAAGITAGLVFGVAMAVRAFRDEWGIIVERHGARLDLATRTALLAEIETQRMQLDALRRDASQRDQFEAERLANRLLMEYFAAKPLAIDRESAMSRGMTRTEWETATGLLKQVGVIRVGNGNKHEVVAPSYAAGWAAVLAQPQRGMGRYVRTADGDMRKVKA